MNALRFMSKGSLLTLFHLRQKPPKVVPQLVKALGWKHDRASTGKIPAGALSFKSTTSNKFSDRGFRVKIANDRVEFEFDPNRVAR